MTFTEYVDGLCKSGAIDGNIADLLVFHHKQEVANPQKPIEESISPILDEMFISATKKADKDLQNFAERIDNELMKGAAE